MHIGYLTGAFEWPAVGGGDDSGSVLSSEELRTKLHHQTKDGTEGNNRLHTFSVPARLSY